MTKVSRIFSLVIILPAVGLWAWDHPGHSIVNRLAVAALPADFPDLDFVRAPAAVDRLAFLSAEPDRWSNASELPARHVNRPDHFLDLEHVGEAGLSVAGLPSFRYDFVVQYAAGRALHAAHFEPIDPARNRDHTLEWPGFLPWVVAEHYGKLKANFAALKAYEEHGTPEERTHAKAVCIEIMGLMGHFVADSAQPLHTTKHYNGWVGPNPNGYNTSPPPAVPGAPSPGGIHRFIDSGLINKVNLKYDDVAARIETAQVLPTAPRQDGRDPIFVAALDFIVAQNSLVETVYQMEKDGRLGRGQDQKVSAEGRALIEGQLLKGGRFLGDLWLTAWRTAPPDPYMRSVLLRRKGMPLPERK